MYRTLMNAKIEVSREPVLVETPGAAKSLKYGLVRLNGNQLKMY